MNLRKTFLALGAMILGVGFFGASPASAACTPPPLFHPTTQQPQSNWSAWPTNGHMRWCGASVGQGSTDANTIKNAAQSATSSGVSTPAPQPRIRHTVAGTGSVVVEVYAWEAGLNGFNDMKAYFGINPVPPGTPLGYTFQQNATKIAVNIFATPNNTTKNTRVTNHEMGHAVDLILGTPSLTAGSVFKQKLALDIAAFNAKPISVFDNYGGLSTTCQNMPNNYERMRCTWPGNADTEYELYANAYGARVPGGIITTDLMSLLNTEFTNVRTYMDNVRKGATAP